MAKMYIGDSVYIDFDGYNIILTTENGGLPTNTIILEEGVFSSLLMYWEKIKNRELKND